MGSEGIVKKFKEYSSRLAKIESIDEWIELLKEENIYIEGVLDSERNENLKLFLSTMLSDNSSLIYSLTLINGNTKMIKKLTERLDQIEKEVKSWSNLK